MRMRTRRTMGRDEKDEQEQQQEQQQQQQQDKVLDLALPLGSRQVIQVQRHRLALDQRDQVRVTKRRAGRLCMTHNKYYRPKCGARQRHKPRQTHVVHEVIDEQMQSSCCISRRLGPCFGVYSINDSWANSRYSGRPGS